MARELRRSRKSLVNVWRDCIRDSKLPATARLVAHTISTYMDGSGRAFPSRKTIAEGASLSDRAVDDNLSRLEAGGFLAVTRTKGRRSNRYEALLPPTANELRRSEWATAKLAQPTANVVRLNSEGASPESSKDLESERESIVWIDDKCMKCNGPGPVRDWDEVLSCRDCVRDWVADLTETTLRRLEENSMDMEAACMKCSSVEALNEYGNHLVCDGCLDELAPAF
jgi:helix-turn-helix protein